MKTTSEPAARLLRIGGFVQGVGYRNALQSEAIHLKLSGWVRNRSDGSVEALVAGPVDALEPLIAWARRRPPAARVAELVWETAESPAQTGFVRLETL